MTREMSSKRKNPKNITLAPKEKKKCLHIKQLALRIIDASFSPLLTKTRSHRGLRFRLSKIGIKRLPRSRLKEPVGRQLPGDA